VIQLDEGIIRRVRPLLVSLPSKRGGRGGKKTPTRVGAAEKRKTRRGTPPCVVAKKRRTRRGRPILVLLLSKRGRPLLVSSLSKRRLGGVRRGIVALVVLQWGSQYTKKKEEQKTH